MEKFYQMQQSLGGIVGPEGPGWPRLDFDAPNRCGFTFLPEMVREEFVDEHAEPSPDGRMWPQPTQCCMEEGDVVITMHACAPPLTLCCPDEVRLDGLRLLAESRTRRVGTKVLSRGLT